MKNYILLLIILCLSGTLKSQSDCKCNYITDYYQLIYKGQLNYLKENFDSAYIYLKQAEQNCPILNNPQTDEIGMLAELSVRKGNFDEAYKYIKLKLENGYKIDFFEEDSIYDEFRKQKQWMDLKNISGKIYDEWYSNLNLDLRKELIQINKEDQRVRTGSIDFEEMKRVDSINIQKLKRIFKEFEYPNSSLIGYYWLDNEIADIYSLIFHIPAEEMEYFKPIFLEFVKCGKAEYQSIYANLIDSNDRGSEMFTYGIYENAKPEKIKDFENLDERRMSVGLPPWKVHKQIQELINKKYNLTD